MLSCHFLNGIWEEQRFLILMKYNFWVFYFMVHTFNAEPFAYPEVAQILFSFRNFRVLGFTLRFMIHFELILMKGRCPFLSIWLSSCSGTIRYRDFYFLYWIALVPLLKTSLPDMYGSISGLFALLELTRPIIIYFHQCSVLLCLEAGRSLALGWKKRVSLLRSWNYSVWSNKTGTPLIIWHHNCLSLHSTGKILTERDVEDLHCDCFSKKSTCHHNSQTKFRVMLDSVSQWKLNFSIAGGGSRIYRLLPKKERTALPTWAENSVPEDISWTVQNSLKLPELKASKGQPTILEVSFLDQ